MAAQADRSLHPFAHACTRERMLTALYGCTALVTVAIGVLGLRGDSWLRQMLETCMNIHALFGLLLCGLVFARYRWRVGHSPRMLPADIRGLSGDLSRIVYLILYVAIGVREIIGILNSLWHGGAIDFNVFENRIHNGPDHAGWDPNDDFQMFFASGLFALMFVRVLAYRLWLRSRERAAFSKTPKRINLERASRNFFKSSDRAHRADTLPAPRHPPRGWSQTGSSFWP